MKKIIVLKSRDEENYWYDQYFMVDDDRDIGMELDNFEKRFRELYNGVELDSEWRMAFDQTAEEFKFEPLSIKLEEFALTI